MTKVIILNAPPNTGKDFISDYLVQYRGANKVEFKAVLRDLVKSIYGIEEELYWAIYNNRVLKEMPLSMFGGKSMRDIHIEVSEDVIKPTYGRDFFGIRAAKSLVRGGLNVFPDSGFMEELMPVVKAVGVENVLIIQLHGVGSFLGDSRGYLPPVEGVAHWRVDPYTKDEVGLGDVLFAVDNFLNA